MSDNNKKIEIYTLEWCPYCRKAKTFFRSKGLDYQEYNIDENDKKEEMIARADGEKSVPQIFINDKKIGGYDSLMKLKSSGELYDILEEAIPNYDDKIWDVIIVGAGPAGLSAAIYSVRKGLDVLVLSVDMGGQVIETDIIDNWIGMHDIKGEELMQSFWKHVNKYEVEIGLGEKVSEIRPDPENNKHTVVLADGRKIETKALIISSGTQKRSLGVDGEKELKGRGVHYCAICDGFLYAGEDVAVIGGGNSGLESALDLAKIDCQVSLIEIADHLMGDSVLQEKVKANDSIDIYTANKVMEIQGEDSVSTLVIRETNTGEINELSVKAVFVEIGLIPNSGFISDLVETNDRDEIKIDEKNKTSVEGIYAAGDVADIKDKQIIVAAAEGAKAALRVNEYLNS